MGKIEKVAAAIMDLTHAEMIEMCTELVQMQSGAKDDGWEWKPTELHGEYGMMAMIHAWADSKT